MVQHGTVPKKGMSGLAIALIVLGVLLVLGLGTCGVGMYFIKRKAESVASEIADGGIVFASPAAVKAELAGAKKEYVGSWTSKKGSTLDIDVDGNLKFERVEGSGSEKLAAPISAFRGDDIELKAIVVFVIPVTSPPRLVGGKWQMVAKGITFERP